MHPNVEAALDADQARHMRVLRESCGMSKADWARAMGVNERTVRNWESGRTPYAYAEQYLAESLLRALVCDRIERDVLAGGGCKRGVRLAQTLYLSNRAVPDRAVRRGVEYSLSLKEVRV